MVLAAGSSFGPYRILDRLGAGGMASVYHAFQAQPQREVALKVISPELAHQPAFRARFRREANVLAQLEHPNILPIYETGEVEGQPYICYRYIRGGTLKDVLGPPLSVAEALRFLAPLADALDFAHRQGVVHRDVKPANVLLTLPDPQGYRTPIVADFGIARLLESALPGVDATDTRPDDGTSLTQVGVGLGTPAYMAPEQVLGQAVDGRVDQYALAITAYQLLTGAVPFSATTPVEVAFMQVHEPLPLPSSRNPAIGPAVEQVLLKALAKPAAERYPTCAAFIDALRATLRTADLDPTQFLPRPMPLTPTAATTAPTTVLASRAEPGESLTDAGITQPIDGHATSRREPGTRRKIWAVAIVVVLILGGTIAAIGWAQRGNGNSGRPTAVVASSTAAPNPPGLVGGAAASATRPRGTASITTTPTAAPSTAPTAASRSTGVPSTLPSGRAFLGVSPIVDIFTNKVLVQVLSPGGPAEQAGIKMNDLLTAFDGTPLSTPDELRTLVAAKKPGDTITLSIIRDDVPQRVQVTLGVAPPAGTPTSCSVQCPETREPASPIWPPDGLRPTTLEGSGGRFGQTGVGA